jgi:TolA-binding protein
MSSYLNFVDKHPQDTSASQYLYKALNLAMGTNQGEKAMELANRTLNEYPKSEKIAETVFLKAFIYENLLSNLGLAQKTYNDFLSRFPDHELADDAQAALNNLGKSPEELIREFEQKAAEAATADSK